MVPYLWVEVVAGGEPALVRVHGELDRDSAPELSAALAPLASRHVQLDLGSLDHLDAAGINTLLAAREASARAGGSLQVIACSRPAVETLDLLGCHHLLIRS